MQVKVSTLGTHERLAADCLIGFEGADPVRGEARQALRSRAALCDLVSLP